jgi:hypothetical protein
MIRIYQYYSNGFQSEVKLSFLNGSLHQVEVSDPKEVEGVSRGYFFMTERGFIESCRNNKIQVIEIKREVTFEMFWERYNYKASGRIPALKAWEKLTEQERISAYDYIPFYEAHLKLSRTAKKYASTYLNSKIYIK